MPREIIRFDGEPVLVHLDKSPQAAIQREGQYGVDWQYIVNHDCGIMWLPEEGRDALLSSGAQAGDEVAIKRSRRGREWVWEIERVSDASEPPPPKSNGQQRTISANNGHLYPPPPLPESKYAKPEAPGNPVAKQLASCLCAAIDSVAEAQTYATSKGLHVQFGAEDIRAIALTVYIGQQRNGGTH